MTEKTETQDAIQDHMPGQVFHEIHNLECLTFIYKGQSVPGNKLAQLLGRASASLHGLGR
jgi:hypothetical protein